MSRGVNSDITSVFRIVDRVTGKKDMIFLLETNAQKIALEHSDRPYNNPFSKTVETTPELQTFYCLTQINYYWPACILEKPTDE